ncbi:perlwapin [Pimephales promelas]|nr:perlwapin [Pimephales promelas]
MITARVYCCSLSVILLCLSPCSSATYFRAAGSGQCPARLTAKLDYQGCTSDRDCSGGYICCSYPRGYVCVAPVSVRPPKPPAKPVKKFNPLPSDSFLCQDDFE